MSSPRSSQSSYNSSSVKNPTHASDQFGAEQSQKERRSEKKKNIVLITASEDFETIGKKVKVELAAPVNLMDSLKVDGHDQGMATPSALSTVGSDLSDEIALNSKSKEDFLAAGEGFTINIDDISPKRQILGSSFNGSGELVYHVGCEGDITEKQVVCYTKAEIIKEDPSLLVYFYERHMAFASRPDLNCEELDKHDS